MTKVALQNVSKIQFYKEIEYVGDPDNIHYALMAMLLNVLLWRELF